MRKKTRNDQRIPALLACGLIFKLNLKVYRKGNLNPNVMRYGHDLCSQAQNLSITLKI